MPEANKNLPLFRSEVLSDEVQDVISYRPHWIVRKGNVLFLIILLSLLSLTWFIQYPDIINGSAKLMAVNPPKLINAKTEGRLVKLFISNEQDVQKGRHLGYIESTASYHDVMALYQWMEMALTRAEENGFEWLDSFPVPGLAGMGELQTSYQQFLQLFRETRQTIAGGYYRKKKESLEKDLQYLAGLRINAGEQKLLMEQDQQLQSQEYKAYEKLAEEKVIAPLELNQYKSKLIAKEQGIRQVSTQITNHEISAHAKQKELLDLQKTVTDQQQKFRSALFELKSEIEQWMQQYVLTAPESGKVLFVTSLQENEYIANGRSLFYVQPPQTKFYAQLMAGQKGLGKIKAGQKVMLKVESYPPDEFGYMIGSVSHVSGMASRSDSFLVKVELPFGLKTNYGKTLFFRNDLSAQAEIITDNRTLFDRLAGQLKQIWKRQE